MPIIIRTPTRTKTKSFKGDQMDFKFPGEHSSDEHEFESNHNETELNNHYLVNESLKSDHDQSDHSEEEDEGKDLITPLLSNNTVHSSPSKPKTINADSSNGYYSFANISDNTTSPSFLHHRDSPESNDDMISILHINSQYPQTLAPKKNVNDTPIIERITSSSAQKKQSMKSIATQTNTIPTADNLSYDIISSESLSRLDSAKLESLRLPSSSSSSNISSGASLLRGSATVKRTPMNLYRKPTMRKVESVVFSSDSSEASDNVVPKPLLSKNNNNKNIHTKPIKNSSRIPSKQVHSTINKTKKLPTKPIRRMSSMRSNPKSNLKRSNAVRCHGGLLQYFEMIGIQIKKLIKQIRLLFFKKKNTTSYQSKNFNTKRTSSFNTTPLPHSTSSLYNKRLRNGKTTTKANKSRVQSNRLKVSHHIPNSSSLQALQPALIEKINPIKEEMEPIVDNHLTATNLTVNKSENDDLKTPMESTLSSPIISGSSSNAATSTTTSTNAPLSVNTSSTRTNSTLRRTNSSIRRAASILTASTPSTNTYYSSMTHPENGSPMRRSKLNKSKGSTSLNSLVRQPSIVVKNKVIPLSMSQYSINEVGESDMDTKVNSIIMEEHNGLESRLSSKYNSPLIETANIDGFDTIKEEDEYDDNEKRHFSGQSQSDSGSSIFTQMETTTNTAEHNEHNIEPTRSSDVSEPEEMDTKGQDDYTKRQEVMRQLMKTYLSQMIQKRIMMRLQMTKFQATDVMDDQYKQMIDELVTDYETEVEPQNVNVMHSKSVNENESDTSSITSSDNDSMRMCQYNATTDVQSSGDENESEQDEDDGSYKLSPMSMQYPSKDIAFGMNTLFGANRDKVLNIPTSTIKRSMTLPIGMKI